eukprot:scaffold202545_cov36-Tisochrysis_lutea.AAC.2
MLLAFPCRRRSSSSTILLCQSHLWGLSRLFIVREQLRQHGLSLLSSFIHAQAQIADRSS